MPDAIELVGYAGTFLTITAYAMRSSIRLRVAGIASSVAFLLYGWLTASYPVMLMEAVLLPLNLLRLFEMLRLVRAVSAAGQADLDFLLPHARRLRLHDDEVLVRQGDLADTMHLMLSGRLLGEDGSGPGAGQLAGDAVPFGRIDRQTRTLRAAGTVEVASIRQADLAELCFQNPAFGYRLAQLALANLAPASQQTPAAGWRPAAC